MLVFITSTSRYLYTRDMLNVCCKQTDDLISFSYNKGRVLPNADKIKKGREALIVFGEFKGKTANPKFIFHPIRFCVIEEAIDNSDNASFTYHLKLKECIQYGYDGNDDKINAGFVGQFNTKILPQLTEGVNNLLYYCREIDDDASLKKVSIDAAGVWHNLVRHLGALEIFKQTIFFRVTSSSNPNINLSETELQVRKPKLLKTGKLYSLNFLLIAGDGVTGSGLFPEIETNENISVQGPFIKQESNAIALNYPLITKNMASKGYSSFLMKVKTEPGSKDPASPEISTYFMIKPRGWIGPVAFLVIVLGLIAPNLAELLPKERIFVLFGTIRVKGAIFVTESKIILSLFAAILSYILYKKLPKAD